MTAVKKRFAKIVNYKSVFSSKEGRGVLKDLIKAHSIFLPVFDPDPSTISYREGERSVVLRIMNILKTSEEEMLTLSEEIEKDVRESSTPNGTQSESDRAAAINW